MIVLEALVIYYRVLNGSIEDRTYQLLIQHLVEPSRLSRVAPGTKWDWFRSITVEVGCLTHHRAIASDLP